MTQKNRQVQLFPADVDFRGAVQIGGVAVAASAAELNRMADASARLVAGGAALSLTEALHDGKTVLFDTAAGTILDLPPATGSGAIFRALVSVTATTNSHILRVAAASDDMFVGSLTSIDVDTADATLAFAAEVADAMDTITFNRTTSGLAAIGDWVEVQDVLAARWSVTGVYRASGVVITPFSSVITS